MKYIKWFFVVLCVPLLFSACKKECSHQYQSQITLQASCVGEGEETFTCALCQHSYKQAIPALDHSYEVIEEKAPSCSEEGLQKLTCSACGASKEEAIEKIPHTLENVTVIKEPNCTQEGQHCGDCTVCGAKQVTNVIATTDTHIFTDTVVRESTCTVPGEGIHTCQLCQYTESFQSALKDHTYSKQNILTEATCTKNGEKQLFCANCDYSTTETIAASGHNWVGASCIKNGTCSACGASGDKIGHTYVIIEDRKHSENFASYRDKKCSVCQDEKREYYTKTKFFDLDAIGEEIVQYAKSRGFNARVEKAETSKYSFSMQVWQADRLDYGPDKLVKSGKQFVDRFYNDYASKPAGIGAYTVLINVYYGQSGALGTGTFGVSAQITR